MQPPVIHRARFRRAIRIALLAFAVIAPPAFAGLVTIYARMQGADALDPVAAGDLPPPAHRPPRVAVVIADDVSEAPVAALLDTFAATLTADSVAVAAQRTLVHTGHGLRLLPRDTTAHLGDYRFVASAMRARPGMSSYDAAIDEVAHSHGGPIAGAVGRLLNYTTSHLDLAGGAPLGLAMIPRALAPALAGPLALQAWRRV